MKQANHEIIISFDGFSCISMMIDDEDVDDEAPLRLWKKVILGVKYDYLCMRLDDFVQHIAIGLNWKVGEIVKLVWCDEGFISKYYVTVTRKKPVQHISDTPKYFN